MSKLIQHINRIALDLIKTAYDNNDTATLELIGIKRDNLSILSDLSNEDCHFIVDKNINLMQITVDITTLAKIIAKQRKNQIQEQLIHDAILLGATSKIMRKYASISSNKFTSLRNSLGGISATKANNIPEGQEVILFNTIKGLTENNNNKLRVTIPHLIDLSKQTNIPIGTIFKYISSHWENKYENL